MLYLYILGHRNNQSESEEFIAKCVYTHKEFVLVLGASSTEVQT